MNIPKFQPGNVEQAPNPNEAYWGLQQAAAGMNRMGEGISKGLSDVGQAIAKVVETKQKISQATQLGENRVNFENDWINAKTEFDQSNPNPDTYYQDTSKLYDKTVETTLGQIKDPEVQQHFKMMMNEHKVTVLDSLSREASQKWLDTNIASKMAQVDMFVDLAGKATDPEYANSYKEAARGVIRSMGGNLIHKTQALDLEQKKMQELDEAGVKNQILIDPTGAAKALAGDGFPDLSPKDRPYYKAQAKTAIKVMENDNENKQVDLVINRMQTKFGQDYTTMEKSINDLNYMQDTFGKDIATNHKVIEKSRDLIRSMRLSSEQAQKDQSDAIAKDTSLNLGKMTIKEINQRVVNGMDWRLGEHFKQELLNPPDIPHNPVEFNRLLGVAYNDGLTRQDKAQQILAGRIPKPEKESLLSMAYRDEDKATDNATREGDKYLRGYLITRGPLEAALPPEEESLYNASQVFHQRIKQQSETAKRSLTPPEISQIAKETAPEFRRGLAARIETWRQSTLKEGAMIQKYNKYKTPESVRAAKDLTEMEKVDILKNKFNYTD
jgi:hypothetical protein